MIVSIQTLKIWNLRKGSLYLKLFKLNYKMSEEQRFINMKNMIKCTLMQLELNTLEEESGILKKKKY